MLTKMLKKIKPYIQAHKNVNILQNILVLGILIALGEAVAYVWSGMYGDLDKLGAGNAILIVI